MKRKLLFAALFTAGTFGLTNAQTDAYGYTTVNATMGASYQNRVFFDLSENTLTPQPANTWDVAFYRVSSMDFGTRINDSQNIEVYEASDDPADWDNINIANIDSWGEPLYNPDITDNINEGAFEQGSATYGWGEYMPNHHIDGRVIFVLKYLNDNSFIKFMITDYFGGYTFKYSKWNGSSWGTTTTKTIANGTTDAYFNYYSLINDGEVSNLEPPRANWDFMFTKYYTFYMNIMMYPLSGVIQSPRITVARTVETQETNAINLPAETEFKKGITTIGHSWKPTSGLIPDVVYYIKEGDKYYRMYFTENGGAATGNMYFKYKDITDLLASNEVNTKVAFGVYPNPAPNKQVTLLYDVKNNTDKKANISIFDMSGKKVYDTEILNEKGFFKKELNLQKLQSGIYIITLKTGNHTESKKLILQ